MQCRFCGEHFPGQYNICPGCGAPVPPPEANRGQSGNSNRVFIILICILSGVLVIGALVAFILVSSMREDDRHEVSASQPVTVADTPTVLSAPTKPASSAPPTTADDTTTVPDVTGSPSDDAIRYLTQAGLTYEIVLEESADASPDAVIRQSLSPRTSVPKGTKVTLYVAKPVASAPATQPPTQPPTQPQTQPSATEADACPYLIKVFPPVYIFEQPSHGSSVAMTLDGEGIYTIVEESFDGGEWWGKLKSGAGWVDLNDIIANGGYVM